MDKYSICHPCQIYNSRWMCWLDLTREWHCWRCNFLLLLPSSSLHTFYQWKCLYSVISKRLLWQKVADRQSCYRSIVLIFFCCHTAWMFSQVNICARQKAGKRFKKYRKAVRWCASLSAVFIDWLDRFELVYKIFELIGLTLWFKVFWLNISRLKDVWDIWF